MSEVGLVIILGFVLLLILGVPIAFSLAAASLLGFWMAGFDFFMFVQRILAGSTVHSLLAIPGFILVGALMGSGGLSRRLVRLASTLIGHFSGGLSMATVGAATFFGAISGSAPATTAAMASMMTDELEKRKYPRRYAAALCTGVGPLGQMIPPSIPMVIWGVLSEQSITRLFLAGAVPGLLAASGFIAVSAVYARVQGIPRESRSSAQEVLRAFQDAFWALLAPVVILGGIYLGMFTPTEAGVVGVLYSLLIGLFVYKGFTLRELPRILLGAMRTTVMIMFVIAMAYAFSWLLALEGVASQITNSLFRLTDNPIVLLLLVNLVLLFIGAFMDNISAMIILSSVLIAVGDQVGLHPIQLGAMVVINFAVGMITPPLGYSLFVASSVTGVSIEEISLQIWPFFLVLIIVVLLVAFVPSVTLWLPSLMG